MNRVILMGRLTKDPDIRYTLAVDRRGRRGQDSSAEQQTADFINCVAFDRAAEFAEKYFRQGMRVLVSGRIQTGSYVNQEGRKVYTTEVILDDQEFADSKGASGRGPEQRQVHGADIGDGFMSIPDGIEDEGLPFS